jgi:putative transposase
MPSGARSAFPPNLGFLNDPIVHLIRHSMDFAAWKDRKFVAQALKTVYRAVDADAGQAALDAFAEGPWGAKYPAIAQSWRRNWNLVIPFCVSRSGSTHHLHH